MKKILFLLLLSIAGYGQTSTGMEQEFDYGIKNNSLQTITTPTYIGTFGTDGTQGKIPSALIAKTSDIADSLATKENIANKSDSYTVSSSTTYASTKALVDGLASIVPEEYTTIVFVNSTNPNTATIFDTVNPPVTNDNGLKNDVANLYIGTDASTWVYDTTLFGYVTKSIPAVSNFFISGSSTDAGNDKTNPIYRNGTVESTGFIKTSGTASQFLKADGSSDSTAYASLTVVPIETGTSFSLDNTYTGKIVIFTSSCTLTIPNGLQSGFNATFVTLAGVTLTVSTGGSVVLFNNVGTTMLEKSSFTLQARTTTNNYITAGAL